MVTLIEKIALLRFKLRMYLSTLKWRLLIGNMGKDVSIAKRCSFTHPSKVKMGNHVFINSDCKFILHDEDITIGNFVAIAPDCTFITANTDYSDWRLPMAVRNKKISKPIVIEDDVWIGTKSVILPGVTIGRGSIVAAGAVVTKNVAPYSIVGWVPAKVIGWRFDKKTIEKAKKVPFTKEVTKSKLSDNFSMKKMKMLSFNK